MERNHQRYLMDFEIQSYLKIGLNLKIKRMKKILDCYQINKAMASSNTIRSQLINFSL